MPTAISIINLKGGVGKTTLTVAVAQMLAGEFRKRVLVVDLDPQTNATVMLIDEQRWRELDDRRLTVADLFEAALRPDDVAPFDLARCILSNVGGVRDVRGVSLLPSSLRLIDLQEKLVTINPGQFYTVTPIDVLRRAIRPLLDDYDFVLIDCPPSLGLITLNGLRISNYYIIPTIADILSTYGIPQIVRRIRLFSRSVGEPIEPLGIVATKYQEQMPTHRTQLQRLRDERDAPVFETTIPQSDKVAAAAEYREVGTYRQKWGYGERHYEAFRRLTQEILDKVHVAA
jgi:chromosome partitioning protein